VSATTGTGLDGLRAQLSARAGWLSEGEAPWGARKRHVLALEAVQAALVLAAAHLRESEAELLAEQLRLAQQQLSALTGALHPDDLLGEIFGSFCIGK
jgi:tRNA modification GTPase